MVSRSLALQDKLAFPLLAALVDVIVLVDAVLLPAAPLRIRFRHTEHIVVTAFDADGAVGKRGNSEENQ